jgi:hypothetical protein
MKQIKMILGIALIAMVGIFTACEEDETATIDITPKTSNPDSVEVNTLVTLQFSIITDENIESIKLEKNGGQIDLKEDNFTDKTSDAYTYSDTLARSNEAGSTLSMDLTVTDSKDNKETYSFDIYVKDPSSQEITLTTYSDIKVYGALGDGTNEDLFSVKTGQVYTYNELSTEDKGMIDFVYAYSDLKSFTDQLVSPADLPSDYHNGETLPNTTYMAKVTDITFSEVDGKDIVENITSLSSKHIDIAEGDVIAFGTENGHKGYLKLTEVNGGTGNASDYIVFDVKSVLASDMP